MHGWAFAGGWNEARVLKSNTFEMEWPPGSGRKQSFPEIDRVGFFAIPEARKRMKETQHPFLDRLREKLAENDGLTREPGK